ncbi:hypothetical protein EVAR_27218_1 [Eumeta japonica]|uniref:Uncharacterized protein n=1 Tax=Eumeta variegata TaxID=151549 RepID=A0A4C1VYH3_EUMVA|nr:hypothetical protein EVAR_27218_1 [Eumeta japonica]
MLFSAVKQITNTSGLGGPMIPHSRMRPTENTSFPMGELKTPLDYDLSTFSLKLARSLGAERRNAGADSVRKGDAPAGAPRAPARAKVKKINKNLVVIGRRATAEAWPVAPWRYSMGWKSRFVFVYRSTLNRRVTIRHCRKRPKEISFVTATGTVRAGRPARERRGRADHGAHSLSGRGNARTYLRSARLSARRNDGEIRRNDLRNNVSCAPSSRASAAGAPGPGRARRAGRHKGAEHAESRNTPRTSTDA